MRTCPPSAFTSYRHSHEICGWGCKMHAVRQGKCACNPRPTGPMTVPTSNWQFEGRLTFLRPCPLLSFFVLAKLSAHLLAAQRGPDACQTV